MQPQPQQGMPPQQMGGGGPPPGGAPQMPPPGGGAQGMPPIGGQPAQHGDPTSNFYNSLQQTLMPFVGKIQGLDQVLAVIHQVHLKYLSPQSQPQPGRMPAKPAMGGIGQ